MRAVVQRVKNAAVAVDGETVSKIDMGLLVLLGISTEDTEKIWTILQKSVLTCESFEGFRSCYEPFRERCRRRNTRCFPVYSLWRCPQGKAAMLYQSGLSGYGARLI